MLDDDTTPVFVISVAAQLAGLHPQTLRAYDRLGLVSPGRTSGRGRRYSARDIRQLREVQKLSQEGINLAGIKRILELENEVNALRRQIVELQVALEAAEARVVDEVAAVHASYRRELVPRPRSRAMVLAWKPAWTTAAASAVSEADVITAEILVDTPASRRDEQPEGGSHEPTPIDPQTIGGGGR